MAARTLDATGVTGVINVIGVTPDICDDEIPDRCPACGGPVRYAVGLDWAFCPTCGYDSSIDAEPLPLDFGGFLYDEAMPTKPRLMLD
jgi:hypothetical protein